MLSEKQKLDEEKQIQLLEKGLCPYCGRKRIESSNPEIACCKNYAIACLIVENLENANRELVPVIKVTKKVEKKREGVIIKKLMKKCKECNSYEDCKEVLAEKKIIIEDKKADNCYVFKNKTEAEEGFVIKEVK